MAPSRQVIPPNLFLKKPVKSVYLGVILIEVKVPTHIFLYKLLKNSAEVLLLRLG